MLDDFIRVSKGDVRALNMRFYLFAGYKSFTQITSDKAVAARLQNVYKDIDNIDLWVGGLAEDHVPSSSLGDTFHKIVREQFLRIRDGDRFWYQRNMSSEVSEIFDFNSFYSGLEGTIVGKTSFNIVLVKKFFFIFCITFVTGSEFP